MQEDVRKTLARLSAEMLSIIAACGVDVIGGRFIRLWGGAETQMNISPDSGLVIFGASMGIAVIASTIAQKNASIKRASVLGIVAGILAALCMLGAAKAGISQGPPVFALAAFATLIIGFGLQMLFNRSRPTDAPQRANNK